MGLLVEVLAVEADLPADAPLLGANVDTPGAGRRIAARALEIGGWALGPSGPAEEAEVSLAGEVLGRAPLRQPRPDIAEGFHGVTGAVTSGFEFEVDATVIPAASQLEVRARVGSATVPIGFLRLRKCWRGELDRDTPALVTVAVVCDEQEGDLDRTLEGIGEQRYAATEVVVVHQPSRLPAMSPTWEANGVRAIAPDRDLPAALRNEAIRCSNGELILFVEAGSLLAPDSLALGVEMLARNPEACGLVDRDARGVGAALYRRSAFEELEGFDETARGDCEIELAERAERYDALLAPGALLGGGRRT